MADAQGQTPSRGGSTLWPLPMIVCLLPAVGHLESSERHDTTSLADHIEDTFTTGRPESGS